MEKFAGNLCIEGLNLYPGFESLRFSRFPDNRIFRILHYWLLKVCLQS